MIATHTMKVNGIVYRAGEEIPSPGEAKKPEKTEAKTYSKSEITTMKAADLRKVAAENGYDNVDDYTGSELKKMLIEKFDL